MGEMSIDFAIRVLRGARVVPIPNILGNPILYAYQNQKFYDIARSMAIQALKENTELKVQIRALERRLETCGADKAADTNGGDKRGW